MEDFIMAQTVIGFFDQSSQAQEAIRELMSRGISRDRIDLSRGSKSNDTNVSSDRSSDGDRHSNSIGNFFRNLFGNDDKERERYTRVAERSNTIVTVHAASREEAETVSQILDRCGAVDVDERAAQYGYGSRSSAAGGPQRVSDERGTTIPRVEENLEVGKREVETGGVRVRSRIVEKPVEEHVRLREEHVRVERQQVNRPLTESDREAAFRERNIELTERSEVPVVNKEARVVEEVRVRKEVNERDETIRDTVRRTDIDINKGDDTGRISTGPGLRDDTSGRSL
jgi:stress response protein YsnF